MATTPRQRLACSLVFAGMLMGQSPTVRCATPGMEDPNDWPQYHRTYTAWRYSPLDQINRANVKRLKVAWIHQPGDITHGIQATPIVLDGIIYYVSAFNTVHAVEGATERQLWKYKPKLDPAVPQTVFPAWSRGVAVGHGRVYLGTLDGRGIAVDQRTGQELWAVQLTPFKGCQGCNFTSPPVIAGDILTFGATGGDLVSSGQIYGVKAATGELVWAFDTISEGRIRGTNIMPAWKESLSQGDRWALTAYILSIAVAPGGSKQ